MDISYIFIITVYLLLDSGNDQVGLQLATSWSRLLATSPCSVRLLLARFQHSGQHLVHLRPRENMVCPGHTSQLASTLGPKSGVCYLSYFPLFINGLRYHIGIYRKPTHLVPFHFILVVYIHHHSVYRFCSFYLSTSVVCPANNWGELILLFTRYIYLLIM
jgi:hypothetical protein